MSSSRPQQPEGRRRQLRLQRRQLRQPHEDSSSSPRPGPGRAQDLHDAQVNLRPEPWVPASSPATRSISWDLDNAYMAMNDLANMFQPGVLNVLRAAARRPQRRRAAELPEGHLRPARRPHHVISDFKKPSPRDSQRSSWSARPRGRQGVPEHAEQADRARQAAPKKREFQGTTIYDFEIPDMPNAKRGSVAVQGPDQPGRSPRTRFRLDRADLARAGPPRRRPSLADSGRVPGGRQGDPRPGQQPLLHPSPRSRPACLLRHDQERPVREGPRRGHGRRPRRPKVGELIDKDKLPDFSVFAKYLSQAGGYGVMAEDGLYADQLHLAEGQPVARSSRSFSTLFQHSRRASIRQPAASFFESRFSLAHEFRATRDPRLLRASRNAGQKPPRPRHDPSFSPISFKPNNRYSRYSKRGTIALRTRAGALRIARGAGGVGCSTAREAAGLFEDPVGRRSRASRCSPS